MDQNKIFNENLVQSNIENILLENKRNNEHTFLNSQLLTILKDLIVKQGYVDRKKKLHKSFQ